MKFYLKIDEVYFRTLSCGHSTMICMYPQPQLPLMCDHCAGLPVHGLLRLSEQFIERWEDVDAHPH